jgi:tetratricopeptide (TPR) repeat protein
MHVTPFVGRERETEQLLALWSLARSGKGQVVLISGEAGIGKSRTIQQLQACVAGDAPLRITYQCSPYRVNTALYPFIRYFEMAAKFTSTDNAATRLAKLEMLLAKPVPPTQEQLALVAALLSIPAGEQLPRLDMTAQEQKEKTLAALVDRLRVVASKIPLLLALEDAHWIDPTSREYVELATRAMADLPAMVILTSRHVGAHPWLTLPYVTQIHLERLGGSEAALMARTVLRERVSHPEFVDELIAKSDGVPLFIEELAKTVSLAAEESEAGRSHARAHSEVPSTLQDSLMARLDRLGIAKEVAQHGAVIGREFSRDLLASISSLPGDQLEQSLETLVTSAVVLPRRQAEAQTFVFKHALLQEAAYASLLRSKRQELHTRLAEALERSYAERVRIEPEIVAHHYTEGGSALRAVRYWAAAAQRALERWANPEALAHATKGLEVLATVPSGGERNPLELGLEILRGTAYRAVKSFASSDAERSFARALELGCDLGDPVRTVDARRGLFSCYYARGALALAREQGREVAALGERLNATGPRMLGHWMIGCMAFWQGDFRGAREELEQAYSLYDPNVLRANTLALQIDPGVHALLHLTWTKWILGYPDQAIATSDQAVETARSLAQPFALAMALFWACCTRTCCGDQLELRRQLDELQHVSAAHKLAYFVSCARVLEAQYLISQGDCAGAFQQIGLAFSEFQSQEAGLGFPWATSVAAVGYLRLRKADQGLLAVGKAFDAVARHGERHWEAELWRLKGELLSLQSQDAQAELCLARASHVARDQSAKSLELRAANSLARLYARRGEPDRARAALEPVYAWFREGFDTADLIAARETLETLGASTAASPASRS